jgi:hypothetical protein
MARRRFSEHFLRFRFEYASLVWDCAAAAGSNTYRWHARLLALLGLPLLLALPAAILAVGARPFGNAYAFSAALVLWPFFLEIPGRRVRQAETTGVRPDDPGNFDFFLFWLFSLLAVVDQVLLLFILDLTHISAVALGILWGIALAGGLDCARTAISSVLAATRGYPLYGKRPLKPGG